MSLRGRTILLTRDPGQSSRFVAEAEARGGRVISFPTITIAAPASWADCDRMLESLEEYDALAFTSRNAVRWFCRRFRSLGLDPGGLRRPAIYAVGARTAEELRRQGLDVAALPEEFSAAALARLLGERSVSGRRVLLPQGDQAREELAACLIGLGARVDPVVVYRTLPAAPPGAESVWTLLEQGGIDIVVFASPSAASGFARIYPADRLGSLAGRAATAAIGPTTAQALRDLGWPPAVVAAESTMSGLLRTIESHFG